MNENSELWIKTKANQDALAHFPYLTDQYMCREEPSNDDGDDWQTAWVIIDLADKLDVTPAQAQFLNTNPHVIEWTIN